MELVIVNKTSPQLLSEMERHYSHPKGFVGRSICYSVRHDGHCYGHIVGGSACRYLPGRDAFLGYQANDHLNHIVNNIFFHVERNNGNYPRRNFTTEIIALFEDTVLKDWEHKYGDRVLAFETLIEIPRSGECYRRAGWVKIGTTKGYTCKRIAGIGTDSWTGKRVWDTKHLRPKNVLIKAVTFTCAAVAT